MPRDFYHVCAALIACIANGDPAALDMALTRKLYHVLVDFQYKAPEEKFMTWKRLALLLGAEFPGDGTLQMELKRIFSSPDHYRTWMEKVPSSFAYLLAGQSRETDDVVLERAACN